MRIRPLLPVAAALLPLLAGCYQYVPADMASVPPPEEVHLYLTRQGMTSLPAGVASPEASFVAGTFVRSEGDSLVVRVPVARPGEAMFSQPLLQEIAVASADVLEARRRRLDRVGTVLLTAGTAGAVAGVALLIGGGQANGGRPPPGPEKIRIPLLSIPFR